jgi:5-methyltetrahydrofolate--homocysteine methyltransferase
VYEDESRAVVRATLHTLRQQTGDGPYMAMSDFVAPVRLSLSLFLSLSHGCVQVGGAADFVGGFAVACHGADKIADAYKAAGDDYNGIMIKAVADRLVRLSLSLCLSLCLTRVRRRLERRRCMRTCGGGCGAMRLRRARRWTTCCACTIRVCISLLSLSLSVCLVVLMYVCAGIRPAPGYPSQPDHHEKPILWKLLNVRFTVSLPLSLSLSCLTDCGAQAEKLAGIKLTESLAMTPAAAVCGLYLAHEGAKYFAVGRIARDQACLPLSLSLSTWHC